MGKEQALHLLFFLIFQDSATNRNWPHSATGLVPASEKAACSSVLSSGERCFTYWATATWFGENFCAPP